MSDEEWARSLREDLRLIVVRLNAVSDQVSELNQRQAVTAEHIRHNNEVTAQLRADVERLRSTVSTWSVTVGNGRVAMQVLFKAAFVVCAVVAAIWSVLQWAGFRLHMPWPGH